MLPPDLRCSGEPSDPDHRVLKVLQYQAKFSDIFSIRSFEMDHRFAEAVERYEERLSFAQFHIHHCVQLSGAHARRGGHSVCQ